MTARIFRILLLLVLALVLVSMLVPNTGLAFIRSEYRWLSRFVSRVEHSVPWLDMDHVVACAVLGATLKLGFPKLDLARAVAVFSLLAAATEIAQFWIPGRTPRVSDAVVDVAGGVAGFLLVSMLMGAWRFLFARPQAQGTGFPPARE